MKWRELAGVLAALALAAGACTTPRALTPIMSPTAGSPSPASPTVPAATPFVLPTVTPGPTPTPVPPAVLRAGQGQATVYAGTMITFDIGGLAPLERAQAVMRGPDGLVEEVGQFRANREGKVLWKRDSTKDALGGWSMDLDGELGTRLRIPYALAELGLPTTPASQGETEFRLYQTLRGAYFYAPTVHTGAVLRVATSAEEAGRRIAAMLGEPALEGVHFYLVSGGEALKREVVAAGADPGAGLEAGVSLYGHKRSGIYIDMDNPATTLPHITAHEISHQVTARVKGGKAPHWLEEGIAEYAGYAVAKEFEPEQEQHWRRAFRLLARRIVAEGTWVSLTKLADQAMWHGESDPERGMQYYAEGFVAVDYIVNTYGEQALRPALDRLSAGEASDAAFKELFGVTAAEFERAVQASVVEMDAHEREIQEMTSYAKLLFEVAAGEPPLNQEWNDYLAVRQRMTRAERIERLSGMAKGYRALAARLEAKPQPAELTEPKEIYRESYLEFAAAMERLVSYEAEGGQAKVEQANQGLGKAVFLFVAAEDRLGAILLGHYIAPKDVLPPTPEATIVPAGR